MNKKPLMAGLAVFTGIVGFFGGVSLMTSDVTDVEGPSVVSTESALPEPTRTPTPSPTATPSPTTVPSRQPPGPVTANPSDSTNAGNTGGGGGTRPTRSVKPTSTRTS